MNISLIGIVIIILLGILIGYKRGFVKIAASLVITIATIILVMMLSPIVSGILQKNTGISLWVEDQLEKQLEEGLTEVKPSRDEQMQMIEQSNMPKFVKDLLKDNNNEEIHVDLGVETFKDYIVRFLTKWICDIIAFLGTFLVLTIIGRIIIAALGLLQKIPLIGGINGTAGAVLGLVSAVLIIWVLFLIITLLYQTPFGAARYAEITGNPILNWLYEKNILLEYISNL